MPPGLVPWSAYHDVDSQASQPDARVRVERHLPRRGLSSFEPTHGESVLKILSAPSRRLRTLHLVTRGGGRGSGCTEDASRGGGDLVKHPTNAQLPLGRGGSDPPPPR